MGPGSQAFGGLQLEVESLPKQKRSNWVGLANQAAAISCTRCLTLIENPIPALLCVALRSFHTSLDLPKS